MVGLPEGFIEGFDVCQDVGQEFVHHHKSPTVLQAVLQLGSVETPACEEDCMRGPVLRSEDQGIFGGVELLLQARVAFRFRPLVDGSLCETCLGGGHHGRGPFFHRCGKGIVSPFRLQLVVNVLREALLQAWQD